MSARSVFCRLTWLSRHDDLLLRVGDARLERIHVRLRLVQLRLADDVLLQQLFAPVEGQLRLDESSLILGALFCAAASCASARISDARACVSSRWASI